jgi:F-type H+-transporting ATPase subunit gamma
VPAAELRQLQRRIRSVQSTRKITRAMEMIATSRIVKAQQRVVAARTYTEEITRIIANLTASAEAGDHPLLRPRDEIRRMGVVVLAADRGLAGAYNANVVRRAEADIRSTDRPARLFLVGRKAESHFRHRGYEIHRAYGGMSDSPGPDDAHRLAADVIAAYEQGAVDAVDLVATQFLSLGTQRAAVRRLLPVERFGPQPGCAGGYELEPGEPMAILDRLLPRYVEARLFAALLDASASEYAARQRAMKAATDNADDLVTSLRRSANQVRQAEITTEIMEIVGGAEALRPSDADESEERPWR